MDGTFIPLSGNQDNVNDLAVLCEELKRHSIDLMYVTGRDYQLVQAAISEYALPAPNWLICDVGASIYRVDEVGNHVLLAEYQHHLRQRVGSADVDSVDCLVGAIAGLRKQEQSKQGEFKLSYYVDASKLSEKTAEIKAVVHQAGFPYDLIASVDPFSGVGLIDLLPKSVSKAYAIRWWATQTQCDNESIAFAGDSGNDLAALTAGYRSIVVSNASIELATEVRDSHAMSGWTDRLHVASKPATSGVLEGVRHFVTRN